MGEEKQHMHRTGEWHHKLTATHSVCGSQRCFWTFPRCCVARASSRVWKIHEAALTCWPDQWRPDVLPGLSLSGSYFCSLGKALFAPRRFVQYLMKSDGACFWHHVAFRSLLLSFLLKLCPSFHLSVSDLCSNALSYTQLALPGNS